MEFEAANGTADTAECNCPGCVAGKLSAKLYEYGAKLDYRMQPYHVDIALQAVYTLALAN